MCIALGTVKSTFSGHFKIDKKMTMTDGSLMQVKIIAETFIKRSSVLITNFGFLFEWPLKTGFTANTVRFSPNPKTA